MKKFNFIISAGLIMIFIMFNSCKKWIDSNYNTDPNNPATVTLATLLSASQANWGYTYGGDQGYTALIWMQQLAGGANQPLAYDQYNYKPGDVDNIWNAESYAAPMTTMHLLINQAGAESPYYRGIGEIEMAFAIGTMTDLFGDIPYSQAFQGAANLNPAFDHQKTIYTDIFNLLEKAIADLNAAKSLFVPGTDDLIYGGDLSLWIKAAYALEARYYIHESIVDANAYTNALTALAKGFAKNSEDFVMPFQASEKNSNPFYQFNEQRGGDIGTGAFIIDTLVKSKDPRLPVYFDSTGTGLGKYVGLAPGVGGTNYTPVGSTFTSASSPVVFMSYTEQLFIEAEAKLKTGDAAGAATAYNNAIAASLAKYSVTDATWLSTYANESGATITLKKIIYQKYLALFLQKEVYNDFRRTGFPVLKLASGISPSITHIPYRYPYGQSEINYNPHTPSISIFVNKIPWMDPTLWVSK